MKELMGTGVALVTPFKEDGSVAVEALRNLIRFQLSNGIDYLVVLGTTGESATLNKKEKQLVIQTVVAENNGKLPLVVGLSGNDTESLVSELKSQDLSAFDAILSVSPYYSRPTQEGIYQHYKAVAAVSPKPILLYNVPGRTGSNMLPETVKRLAEDFENIIGIKEAAGNMVQAMKLKAIVPKNFLLISGDDLLCLPIVLAGGAGVISVIGQAFPKEFSQMVNLGLEHKPAEAYQVHYKLTNLMDLIFVEGNPAGIKCLLEKRGIPGNQLRLPLVKASQSLSEEIQKFLDEY